MSRCIIHVGPRKTGSSSIQESLNGFADENFIFGDVTGQTNHGAALYSLFADDPTALAHHRKSRRSMSSIDEYIKDARNGLKHSIESACGRTIIFSGEIIGHLFTLSELRRLCDYFREHFIQVDIVAYVRPPAAHMGSNFQQRVKDAGSKFHLHKDYINYREIFSKFDVAFGPENVYLWKFDPAIFPNGCVVRDFCNRLGIDFLSSRIKRVNESISREAIALLYTYRKFGLARGSRTMTGPQNRKLIQQLIKIGGTKFRLSPDLTRPVLANNRADIEWMEARLGQSLQEDLGEHQPGDVRDESSLLSPNPEAVGKLLTLLGDSAPVGIRGQTPEEVALLVHALRRTHNSNHDRNDSAAQVKVADLIEKIQEINPALFDGISENRAAALIRTAFENMNDTLTETEEGVVNYAGLGRFRVKKVENEVGGKKTAPARTQVIFHRAEPSKKNNGV